MTRKLSIAALVIALAFIPWISVGAQARGGGFHGGNFHHRDFRFRGGAFLGDPFFFGAYPYPYAAGAPAVWYFCPPANAYYPAVASCPAPWQPVYPQ